MPGPWDKYAQSSAQDGPWAKYAAPSPIVAPKGFPYDEPGVEYGSVLPLARDTKTDKLSLAVPEMIRAPLRGGIEWGKEIMGKGQGAEFHETPDEAAAVMAFGMLPEGAAMKVSKSPVKPMAAQARDAGYVLPPEMATEKPGAISTLLSGWGGKVKLQQQASERNQEVTNELAGKALGLPSGTMIDEFALQQVRAAANQKYAAIPNALPDTASDQAFTDAMSKLGGRTSHAAQHFPSLMDNESIKHLSEELATIPNFPTQAGLELVRQLRFDATGNLKAIGDPGKHALGLAQRQAADGIDDLIERNLERIGKPDLAQQYRAARQLIAKSYDVEAATNLATGDVNATGLARLGDRGRPLSGELKIVADTAKAFPKAMQNPAKFGGTGDYSALDFFGSALAMAHGNPSIAGTILARPIARSLALSEGRQDRLVTPPPPKGRVVGPGPVVQGAVSGQQPNQ